MQTSNAKFTGALLFILVLAFVSLTGCQPIQAQVLAEADPTASAEGAAPAVELRFSPSYYRDDPDLVGLP